MAVAKQVIAVFAGMVAKKLMGMSSHCTGKHSGPLQRVGGGQTQCQE